jgi:hypothetical protein
MKDVSKMQQKPPAPKREHLALQNNTIHVSTFSFFVGHYCPPGSGATTQTSPVAFFELFAQIADEAISRHDCSHLKSLILGLLLSSSV